jgi:hypothetical protein
MGDNPKAAPHPELVVNPGHLPPFWDRNATFVANLLGLFFGNEEKTRLLAEEVGEVDSYGGRLVPVLELIFAGPKSNLLVLERAPDPALCHYFKDTLGLSLPEIITLPHHEYLDWGRRLAAGCPPLGHPTLQQLASHHAPWIDGYVTDHTLAKLATLLEKTTFSSHQGSRLGNDKALLHRFLESAGLPVIETSWAESPEDVKSCLSQLARAGFSSAVIKCPIGASGIGLVKVPDTADPPPPVPDHFFDDGPCLVQGWLKPGESEITSILSPSVQLFLDDQRAHLYDITEQILTAHSVHEGNESPPPFLAADETLRRELLQQASVAARWLHQQGYRGTASVDFLVARRSSRPPEVFICEINARVTGATYPSVLARHFMPDGAWLMRNLRFSSPVEGTAILQSLRDEGDLFIPGSSEAGIIPINLNFGSDGLVHKGQFLCLAHSAAGSHTLLGMAELALPCVPDRD